MDLVALALVLIGVYFADSSSTLFDSNCGTHMAKLEAESNFSADWDM